MTTTGEAFRRVEHIVDAALARPTAERESFVRKECGDDTDLFTEVSTLLAAYSHAGDFMETAAVEKFKGALLSEGERVGNYTILKVLGSGGGGTVYLAQQDQPRRHVALKAMHGGFTTETAALRFQQEAEILARLQHPSIAHVYEAGVHDGIPFIVLEYVENATTVLDAVEGKGRAARLRLFADICDAVHAGHGKGVVHRDLKPANILVLPTGHPKIIDFGIARVEKAGGAGAAREIAGTPPYMSPEQCTPDLDVDHRSDVYSLGVVLYELLVGRLPHDVSGTPIVEATRRIRELPPAPLDGGVPADLRAIVAKAMHKSAEQRYGSASRLADDVRRYLDRLPVTARPAGRVHDLGLFVRRNPAVTGVLAVLMLVLTAATIVSWGFANRATEARDRERIQAYVAHLSAASAAIRDNDVAQAKRSLRLAAPELRNWEWHYLASRLDESIRTIHDPKWLTFAAVPLDDGDTILEIAHEEAMDGDGSIGLWSLSTGEIKNRVTFPEYPMGNPLLLGPWIACGTRKGTILIVRKSDLEIVRRIEAHDEEIGDLAAGAELISVSEGTIRVWETETWTLAKEFGDEERLYGPMALSRDGALLAVADATSIIDVWDVKRGERLKTLEGHETGIRQIWFDGEHIVSMSADETMRVWDIETGREVDVIRGLDGVLVTARDKRRLLTGHVGGKLQLWDLDSKKIVATFLGHEQRPRSIHFLPNERALSADASGGIRIWDLKKGATALGRYSRLVNDVAYSGDGNWIATAAFDGTARLYRRGEAPGERILRGHEYRVQGVAFSTDSRQLVSCATDETLKLWDVDTGECVRTIEHTAPFFRVAFDRGRIAAADTDNNVVLWDAPTGEPLGTLPHGQWATGLFFLQDDQLLTTCRDGKIRLWDLRTKTQRREMSFLDKIVGAALSPDGETLVVTSASPFNAAWRVGRLAMHFVDLKTWKRLRTVPGIAGPVAFHPNGSRLAMAFRDRVLLIDPASGRTVLEIPQRPSCQDVAFSPDGTQLAAAAGNYEGHGCELRIRGRVPGVTWPPKLD